jgi:hypothetical protein
MPKILDAPAKLGTGLEARQLEVTDAPDIAYLANACAVLCEGESDYTAALLRSCGDLLIRQHIMLLQANLLPRQELEPTGSTH